MMEEIESTEQEKESRIMDELEEAALTNVSPDSSKEGSPALSSSSSMTQSMDGLSTLPPPSMLPPELTSPINPVASTTPEPSTPPPPTSGFVPSQIPLSSSPPKSFSAFPQEQTAIFTPEPSQDPQPSPYNSPYYVAPAPVASPHLEDESALGPVYPVPGDKEQARGGLFGWGGKLVNSVMQKTKSSVETMITTLDPGMKEVIYSGGDIDIVVTSTKDSKVGGIRDAFQQVFGKATVVGMESQPSIAPQPVGFTAGLKGAEERIEGLRRTGAVHEHQTVVSIESFIAEMLPDSWFDVACVLLKDPLRNIELHVFSQATPLDMDKVQRAQDATPSDYNLRWSGLSVTVGEIMEGLDSNINRSNWHESVTGVSRKEMIYFAGKVLAGLYQRRIHLPNV